jgi:hypothetical protein
VKILLAALPLVLALSCYTRFNHPQILAESRWFSPAPDADCASCHAGETWMETGSPTSYTHRGSERWSAFQGGPAESRGGWSSSYTGSPATPAPQLPATPDPPRVMGQDLSSPRLAGTAVDSAATPVPEHKPRAPVAKKSKRHVKPAEPAKSDSPVH